MDVHLTTEGLHQVTLHNGQGLARPVGLWNVGWITWGEDRLTAKAERKDAKDAKERTFFF